MGAREPRRAPAEPGRGHLAAFPVYLCALAAGLAAAPVPLSVPALVFPPAPPRPHFTLFDETPVRLTVTAEWQKIGVVVPTYLVPSDRTLWRRMHFEDWDTVSSDLRQAALAAMVEQYHWAMDGPRVWRWMTAADWDAVPQPIRAMALIRMARYWTRYYESGREYDLAPALVGDTVASLIMVESWFEHRGAYRNADGTRDLGVGGASAYCRNTIRRLYADHRIDFSADDEDYVNPWVATRVMAIWFTLMIHEADGDLETAMRAYNVGTTAAKRGLGADYAANAVQKRRRFIRNGGAPPSWRELFAMTASRAAAER